MKQFLINLVVFTCICVFSMIGIFCLADGTTDEYYLKFTTPKQTSLIIGCSRAAQGIQPKVLNAFFPKAKIYNYAFSRVHTPYGKAYLESIIRKLKKETTNGVFIVEVDPWTISSLTKNPEDSLNFHDNKSFAAKVKCVNCNPNVEYLINSYGQSYNRLISAKFTHSKEEKFIINNDGWCEVMLLNSNRLHQQRIEKTIYTYRKRLKDYSGLSETRLKYLEKTLEFLQQHGTVYMVRLPVSSDMLDIENELIPNFDSKMLGLSKTYNVPYFNFISLKDTYQYNDGHHLTIESGKRLSRSLADSIQYIYKK